jgi:hypothetical protein
MGTDARGLLYGRGPVPATKQRRTPDLQNSPADAQSLGLSRRRQRGSALAVLNHRANFRMSRVNALREWGDRSWLVKKRLKREGSSVATGMRSNTLSPEFCIDYLHKLDSNWTPQGAYWADKGTYRSTLSAEI